MDHLYSWHFKDIKGTCWTYHSRNCRLVLKVFTFNQCSVSQINETDDKLASNNLSSYHFHKFQLPATVCYSQACRENLEGSKFSILLDRRKINCLSHEELSNNSKSLSKLTADTLHFNYTYGNGHARQNIVFRAYALCCHKA